MSIEAARCETLSAKALEDEAERASRLLAAMANPKRLLVLCNLLDSERSVGALAEIVGLSQGALSQHLQRLRSLDIVATRRDAQTIYYRLASPEAHAILQTLHALYCAPDAAARSAEPAAGQLAYIGQ